jgi:uracil-DNA glycosylase family 4
LIIKGEGDTNAKIYIIGEAPGKQEEEKGRPFCGGAGSVLDSLLSKSGIERSRCYVDNVINTRPPNNNFSIYYSDSKRSKAKQELIEAHRKIREKIRAGSPNVVVALGNESLYALTGVKSILKWRGSILNANGIKVIPTIHPAMVMREPKFEPVVAMDFKRIAEEALFPEVRNPYRDRFLINPTFDQVMHFLKVELPKKDIVTFDIETIPDMEQIMCLGFAWAVDEAICIPIFFGSSSYWNEREEFEIIKAIQGAFALPGIKWVAQNAQYDLTYLLDKWSIPFPKLWMDTMTAFHDVYPEMRKSLAFLTSIYTKRPYFKDDGGQGATPDQEWTYNCKDCCVTYECALEIRKEMEEFGTLEHYNMLPLPLTRPLVQMQRRGVLIDITRRDKLDKELEAKELELQARLDKAVGHSLNVASPKQVKEFLYDDLGLPPIYKWGTQKGQKKKVLSCDETAIETLQKRTSNPVLSLILEIRGIRKLLGTYVRASLEHNNRICCSYKIAGTETGRLSSSKSIYDRGTNLQNIPREASIRSMFIPEAGSILVNADLSQAEARVVAYLAREERLQALFEQGGDIHTRNACNVYKVTRELVSKDQRQIAKSLVHGANYGIGHVKFSKLTGQTEGRSRELLNQYHSLYPCLQLWHREVREQVGKTRIMTTPLGRKRMFFGRWSEDLVREAIAYVPQSTVGDLLNLGIIRAWDNLPPGWELILQNHDSVLAQVPKETPDMHIWKFFKHYFEISLTIHNKTFKVPVDIKVGKSWGEMKDLKI